MSLQNIIKSKINFDRIKRLSKEGFWITIGQIMAMLGSLVGITVLSGLMTPAEYGELALGMTAFAFVGQLIIGPLGNGVVRFYAPAAANGSLTEYFNDVLILAFRASLLIIVVGLILAILIYLKDRADIIILFVLSCLFGILSGANSLLNGIQNSARMRANAAIHQGLESWCRFLAAAGFMLLIGHESEYAMLGYCISALIILTSQLYFFRKKIIYDKAQAQAQAQEEVGNNWKGRITNFSLPFASWGIFTWGHLVSDRWALGLFSSADQVGFYVIIYQLGYYPISMAMGVVVNLITPIIYQRAGDASDQVKNRKVSQILLLLTGLSFALTFIIFLLALLFHEVLFSIIIDEKYKDISYLLPWMILAGGIFSSSQIVTINILSQMNSKVMKNGKIVTALFGIIMNCLGAFLFGIDGLVAGMVIFAFLHLAWFLYLSKQQDANSESALRYIR